MATWKWLNFLKMTTTRDYYDILGVSKSASGQEIKQAYRKQALQWHPDRNKSSEAEQRFKEINEAYEILSDPDKKAAFDQFGHAAFEQGGMGAGGFGGGTRTYQQGPFTYTYTTTGGGPEGFDFDFGGFSDPFEIFEQFFGGASPFGSRGRQIPRYGLTITFDEAVHGVEKTVEIEGKRRIIKIPPGVEDGSRIKFPDFYVTLDVKPDKVFKREGDDIITSVTLPLITAILGGVVEVPTIDETVKLKIRPGTQPGTLMRLQSRGVKHLHSSGRGDQYIRLQVQIPDKLSRHQRDLLEEFERESGKSSGWF